jgi:hypothetical protein
MKHKIVKKHAKDCYAVRNTDSGQWDSPWSGIVVDSKWGRKNSLKRQGSTHWLLVSCNCTYCPARLAVVASVLYEGAPTK